MQTGNILSESVIKWGEKNKPQTHVVYETNRDQKVLTSADEGGDNEQLAIPTDSGAESFRRAICW